MSAVAAMVATVVAAEAEGTAGVASVAVEDAGAGMEAQAGKAVY